MEATSKQIQLDSKWFSPERDVSRTKGLHLSSILDYIEHQEGLRAIRDNNELSPVGHSYATGGFAWERLLGNLVERSPVELWEWMFGRVLAEPSNPKIIRPGEQCLDGGECPTCKGEGHISGSVCVYCAGTGRILIYLTPDGLNLEDLDGDGLSFLEEWKWTTKSSNGHITGQKFKRWVSYQIPAYLKALRLRTCRLRVYHARGDYSGAGVPVWMEHILKYNQTEIDETWNCISNNARVMVSERLA